MSFYKAIILCLILEWKNQLLFNSFLERTELPDEIIKQAVGETLVKNEGVQVLPITDSDNQDVNSNSALLIQKSQQTYSQEKRILQVF